VSDCTVEQFQQIVDQTIAQQQKEFEARRAEDPNAERWAKVIEAVERGTQKGYEPGQRGARLVRAYLASGEKINGTMDLLRQWGSEDIRNDLERSLQLSRPDGVGLLIPEEYSDEFIPMLRPYSTIAAIMPREVTMKYGTLNFARVSTGTLAYWRPPQANIKQASAPVAGRLTLQEKALTMLVPFPNRLLESNSAVADQFILQDMLAGGGQKLDEGFVKGTGDEYEPLGLVNYGTTGRQPFNSMAGGAFSWDLPIKMIEAHRNGDGSMVRPFFLMNWTLWRLLMTATTGSAGFLGWTQELATRNSILGVPVFPTRHIATAATSNNPTTLILGDAQEYLLGIAGGGFRVARSQEAAYYDANQTLVGAFPNNETVVRAIWSGDMGVRQHKSFTINTGVQTT